MNWIEVKDSLPTMYYIGEGWHMSKAVLAYGTRKYPRIMYLNHNTAINPDPEWLEISDDIVTHWMPITPPIQ